MDWKRLEIPLIIMVTARDVPGTCRVERSKETKKLYRNKLTVVMQTDAC